jgi:sortase A
MLQHMEKEDYTPYFEEAEAYNKELAALPYPMVNYGQAEGYFDILDLTGTGVMGYLTIDVIGVELPVYHGTSDSVLSTAVGHLQGSSLPIGGESTHCVVSAHRGLPTAVLITHLDRMEIGDTFQVVVLDQVLTYRVDQVKTITPTEIGDLQIVNGMDYCTLFTCTPYGINTHRLLVRGVRIETVEEKPIIYVSNEAFRIEPMLVTPIVAAPMLLVLLIHLLVKYREPPKNAQQNKKEENANEK